MLQKFHFNVFCLDFFHWSRDFVSSIGLENETKYSPKHGSRLGLVSSETSQYDQEIDNFYKIYIILLYK